MLSQGDNSYVSQGYIYSTEICKCYHRKLDHVLCHEKITHVKGGLQYRNTAFEICRETKVSI